MDGWRLLAEQDPLEVTVRRALLRLAIEDQERVRQDLAVRIAQQVGRLFGGRG